MTDSVIAVDGVSKRFGDTVALSNCSLSVNKGEVHAIVGENGSGKSTLAKVIAGILPPDSGSVSVLGARPRSPHESQRRGIAMVMQEILVVEGASVLDNLFLGHEGMFRSAMTLQAKLRRAAELLEQLTDAQVNWFAAIESLPLSVQQCVVIARALLGQPSLLIMDEATSALDGASSTRLYQLLEGLATNGASVVTVTHRIEELRGFAGRATVLRDGSSVGIIAREDISEQTLLAMMSGVETGDSASAVQTALSAGEVRLRVRAMRTSSGGREVDLEVSRGEILGFAALEGHGGPDVVQAIAGVRQPSAGSIEVVGEKGPRALSSLAGAVREGVAYVSGDRKREGTFPNMSVLDNFGMPLYRSLRRGGLTDVAEVRRRYDHFADELSLRAHGWEALIGTLSGGNQQKVLLGRALAQAPGVLVLNDPTRGVDLRTKRDIYRLLNSLSKAGMTTLFFSTELEELIAVCHRVAVLRNGGIFAILRDDELTSPHVLNAMFGRRMAPNPSASAGTRP